MPLMKTTQDSFTHSLIHLKAGSVGLHPQLAKCSVLHSGPSMEDLAVHVKETFNILLRSVSVNLPLSSHCEPTLQAQISQSDQGTGSWKSHVAYGELVHTG